MNQANVSERLLRRCEEMKLEKVIAVRTDKTVYRDGDKAIKVFSSNYQRPTY